jgi:hypothetical protein
VVAKEIRKKGLLIDCINHRIIVAIIITDAIIAMIDAVVMKIVWFFISKNVLSYVVVKTLHLEKLTLTTFLTPAKQHLP